MLDLNDATSPQVAGLKTLDSGERNRQKRINSSSSFNEFEEVIPVEVLNEYEEAPSSYRENEPKTPITVNSAKFATLKFL